MWRRFWRWLTIADAPVMVPFWPKALKDKCFFCDEPATSHVSVSLPHRGISGTWRTCLKHMNTPLETLRGDR